MSVEPFRISVPDPDIDDLHARLERTRWPVQVGEGWSEGTDAEYLRDLVTMWRWKFDWRAHETALNSWPQVVVDLGEVSVHAVHQSGVGPHPFPLVMTHGWPSTFAEFDRVVGPLADPGAHGGDPADAFHVVVPSLPGYGFSGVPSHPGMTPRRIAALWVELMERLGYVRFAAHGCDWGSYVTALLGLDAPDRLVGVHMGMLSLRGAGEPGARSAEDEAYASRARRWRDNEQGYVAVQSTKPQTLAYGLNDSPAGLAAWIAEKWRSWSDCEGVPENAISRDDLLTAISIYWFTGTIGPASRLYRESRRAPVLLAPGQRVPVPAGFILESAGEEGSPRSFLEVPRIGAPPRERAERAFDVHRWTVLRRGGHFPALEAPEAFVDEVRAFFRPLRG